MYWVQLETDQAVEEDKNTALSWVLAEYWDDAWKYVYDYDTDWTKYINIPKQIVIHHTAWETCDPNRISTQHRNDKKKWTGWMNTSLKRLPVWLNKTGWSWEWEYSDVRYHFIIQADWKVDVTRYESEVGRWTRVNNIDVLHIAFCWDFTDHEPTTEQYKAWGKLIWELRERHWDMPVETHWHLDWEATSCAWKMFDSKRLSFFTPVMEERKQKEIIIRTTSPWKVEAKIQPIPVSNNLWKITAYYNCVEWQDSYYKWNYEAEKKMNWCWAFAAWWYGLDEHKYNHWACPREYPLGTKLWIDWWSETYGEFTCVDRGSWIQWKHIDLWYWIGQSALDNIRWWLPHPTSTTVKVVKLGTGKK